MFVCTYICIYLRKCSQSCALPRNPLAAAVVATAAADAPLLLYCQALRSLYLCTVLTRENPLKTTPKTIIIIYTRV